MRGFLIGAVASLGALAVAELLTFQASRQGMGDGPDAPPGAGEAIIVLGCPTGEDGRPSFMQRYRCRIAARSRDRTAGRSKLVFTGRSRNAPGIESEAAVMARYAIEVLGVDAADVVLEEDSQYTWENIAFSLPFIEDMPVVKIVSNTWHARRGRQYLHRQAPDLARRLRPAADHRFGELLPLKPIFLFWQR